MGRNVMVVSDLLDAALQEKIRETARSAGFVAEFYARSDEAMAHTGGVEVIYSMALRGIEGLVKAAPNLKWFCSMTAGVDPLLPPGVLPEGCQLTNSSGAYGLTLAEHLVMVTLMLLRRYPEYDEIVRARKWRNDLPLRSIKDSRFTLLGTGDIGTRYAERIRAFEPAAILGVNRSGRKPSDVYDEVVPQARLDEVLPQTDVLVMSLPGTAETKNILSRERLALLPHTAFLINVGRGSALDQAALIEATEEGRLAGAALDVMREEPILHDDPLWSARNILITPHCAGNLTLPYTREKNVSMFCENLVRFAEGKPLLHLVKRELGY